MDHAHTDWAAFALTHDIDAMEVLIAETRLRVSEMLIADWRLVERSTFLLLSSRPERLDADDVRRVVPVCTIAPAELRALGTPFSPGPCRGTSDLGSVGYPMADATRVNSGGSGSGIPWGASGPGPSSPSDRWTPSRNYAPRLSPTWP